MTGSISQNWNPTKAQTPNPKESRLSSHRQIRSNHQVVFRQGREVVEVGRDLFNECCVVSWVADWFSSVVQRTGSPGDGCRMDRSWSPHRWISGTVSTGDTRLLGSKSYRAGKAHEVTRKVVHHIRAFLVRVLLAVAIHGSRRIKGNAIEWAVTV